MLGKQKL